jgi:hypothetical protein
MLEENTWYRFEGSNPTGYDGEPQVQPKRWTTASETTPENERTNIEERHQHLTATATAKETESGRADLVSSSSAAIHALRT